MKKPNKIFLRITTRILISERFSKPSHYKNHILSNQYECGNTNRRPSVEMNEYSFVL